MEESGKVKKGKEILDQIKEIKSSYEAEQTDEHEEELSFLDRFNRLIQLILDDETISVYQALDKESLDRWKKKRFSRWFKKLVFSNIHNTMYFLLLATITGFLVSEALSFYSIDGFIDTKTYVKAILTEICFIFLSGYRASGKLQILWVSVLRTGIFCLMMFVISSQTISIGTGTISESDKIQEQVVLLEKQIKEKEKEITYYRDVRNWPLTTKQLVNEKGILVNKLIDLKDKQASGKNQEVSEVERYKMYGRAAFRIILLFISVLITRRIFSF